MSFFCWKCNGEIPDGTTECPYCKAELAATVVNRMETIVDYNQERIQILPGVTAAGRYEVKHEIGRGGMGIVYLAFDRILEITVALKVIPYEICQDPRAVQNLKRETTIALDLTHDHIVRLYNLEIWEGQAFVTMENVSGRTLAHLLEEKGGSLSLTEALPIFREIASALDYAHSKKSPIVHRDLKLLNILITEDGHAKVSDYGLARVYQDSVTRISHQEVSGTLAYMAPEQIRGKGIGPWTDIYAFACLIYEVLTGDLPFTTGDLQWQIMHEEPEFADELQDTVRKALRSGLAKQQADRPVSASALVMMIAGEVPPVAGGVRVSESKRAEGESEKEALTSPAEAAAVAGGSVSEEDNGKKATRGKRKLFTGLLALLILLVVGLGCWSMNYFEKDGTGNHQQSRSLRNLPGVGGNAKKNVGVLLSITSTPPDVKVYIDGGLAGRTPLKIKELPGGTHVIKLAKNNYIDYQEKVFIQKDKTTKLTIPLEPRPFGNLKVSSEPPGAAVYIDGEKIGKTPLSREHLKKGIKKLVIKKGCYADVVRSLEIVPLKTAVVEVELESVCGGLKVTSKPAGADVYLEGKKIGTTPFAGNGIRKGSKKLELKKDYYFKAKRNIEITALETSEVAIELEAGYGNLRVSSNPVGASVYLNGKKIGQTPFTKKRIKKGSYKLELRKECFASLKKTLKIKPLETVKTSLKLTPTCGELEVLSDPQGATVFLDEKEVGVTPLQLTGIKKGGRQLVVRQEGYDEVAKAITIVPSRQLKVPLFTLQPQAGTVWVEPVIEMPMVWVPGGSFDMGGVDSGSDAKPVHKVKVDDFWIGKYEVTQSQWVKIMGSNPTELKKGGKYPIENISWNECQDFIKKLNAQSSKTYRLPTEAEWEYACRSGGKGEKYSGSEKAGPVAWYLVNSVLSAHPVGSKQANGLGLHDMSGNVSEWCMDWYGKHFYEKSPEQNPQGPSGGTNRVVRGGGWVSVPWTLCSSYRSKALADSRRKTRGFRLVRSE